MSNSTRKAPAPGSLEFAEKLARKFAVPLSSEQQQSSEACSAFIEEWRGAKVERWKELKGELRDLFAWLPGVVSATDQAKAQVSIRFAEELRQRCVKEHSGALLAAVVNGMDRVSPELLDETLELEDPEARLQHLRDASGKRLGHSRIRPEGLHSVQQKCLAYWIEGLQSTAFDALGGLQNCLGEQTHFTALEDLLEALQRLPVDGLKLDDSNPPERTVVLKIIKPATSGSAAKPPVVIATLPLAALAHDDARGPGYRWQLAGKGIPVFNRAQLGPAASIPGLRLEHVEAFDRSMERRLGAGAKSADLAAAMALWDQAFDTLVEDWPAASATGVAGWLAHFKALAGRPRPAGRTENCDYVWQVARWQAVFTLVDGSAVAGATAAVSNAYRHFLDCGDGLPVAQRALFDRLACLAAGQQRSFDVAAVATESHRLLAYFGHMDSRDDRDPGQRSAYPLDPAQRDALLALVETGDGEVLAVNGPPGTGKTSLLRGVIASVWVQPLLASAASAQPECPMIVACAATNPAVTNIISSFNETPGPLLFDDEGQRLAGARVSLESRWLPALISYGWYAPASIARNDGGKGAKAGKPGIEQYQVIHRGNPGQDWAFHGRSERLQHLDLELLENVYLDCAAAWLGKRQDLKRVIAGLHRQVLATAAAIAPLESAVRVWLQDVPRSVLDRRWREEDQQRLGELDLQLGSSQARLQRSGRRLERLQEQADHLATGGPSLELPELLADTCADLLAGFVDRLPTDEAFDACVARVQACLLAQSREHREIEVQDRRLRSEHAGLEQARVAWQRNRQAALDAHAALCAALAALAVAPAKIVKTLGAELADSPLQEWLREVAEDSDLEPCRKQLVKRVQDLLDTEVRSRLFHLAARYWEGRYLLARRDAQQRGQDDPAWSPSSARQLRTLAMLAPVFVVTAFSVPKLMRARVSGFDKGMSHFLFGEADLLIVDEAGQGSPEIGAAPFLFARRAIVVGDVEQLEPVWSISAAADGIHAAHYRLGDELDDSRDERSALQRLGDSGNLMSSGSVMRMAQRASAWADRRFAVPGLTLTNHYRCLKPIIEVCNSLVYRGALVPARKEPEVASLFRPELQRLAYLVVEELVDTRNPGGSRRNRQEAALIAAWIRENAAALLRHYDPHGKKGLRLKDVVAVITPFTGQIGEIQNAIAQAHGVPRFDAKDGSQPYHGMTIDTVHSLQGAEKPVVLFSMVESGQPAQAQFYDRGSNLINVAISRAKDLFITAMSQAAVEYARTLADPATHPDTPFKASDYLWHATVCKGSRLNARHLVLVESPKKCAVIHQALDNSIEWAVAATQGNITQLADASSWSIREACAPQWQPLTPVAEQTLERVARLWPGLECLYLATDPDAEGEQIAWQLLRTLKDKVASAHLSGAPAIRRMRFHSLEPAEIRRARDEAGSGLDAGMVKSALTRVLLDGLIGVEYPRRLGVDSGESGYAAGVGRLQLGILDLVQRHAARRQAKRVRVEIPLADQPSLHAQILPKGEGTALEEIPAVSAERAQDYAQRCQQRLDGAQIRSLSVRREIRQLPAYPALNTGRMLELAWRAAGLGPDAAMNGLQHLYESHSAQRHAADEGED